MATTPTRIEPGRKARRAIAVLVFVGNGFLLLSMLLALPSRAGLTDRTHPTTAWQWLGLVISAATAVAALWATLRATQRNATATGDLPRRTH